MPYLLPVNKLLCKSGLNSFDLNNVDAYVSVKQMYVFLNMVTRELGGESLSVLFRDKLRLVNAGFVGENTVFTPDLLSAVNYGVKYHQYLLSNE
jgi:hypothetical protein